MCEVQPKESSRPLECPESTSPSSAPAPLNFWEIDMSFRCPVVGMCLTPREQRQLLKKVGITFKNKTAYDIHEILVSGADTENRLSQKVQRLLHRKYGLGAGKMHGLSERDFMCLWKEAFSLGDYLTEFWAAVTRPDLSLQSKKDIFGAIHMAMHTAADLAAQTARLKEEFEGRAADQARTIRDLQRDRKKLHQETRELNGRLAAAISTLQDAEQKMTQFRNRSTGKDHTRPVRELERENLRLTEIMANQAAQMADRDRMIASLNSQVAHLSEKLANLEQADAWLRDETQDTLQAFMEIKHCDAACPAFDLCKKRVLIVGGIARMESLYRRLVENNGGVLEYHDGCVNGGARKLENHLRRSDVVICPVNCNSHAACALVKHLGKKHNKPVHMLPNFSLSAVSLAIRACSGGPGSQN